MEKHMIQEKFDAMLRDFPPTPLEMNPRIPRTGFGSYVLRALLAEAVNEDGAVDFLNAFREGKLRWPTVAGWGSANDWPYYAIYEALLDGVPPTGEELEHPARECGFRDYLRRLKDRGDLTTDDVALLLVAFRADTIVWPSRRSMV